MPDNHELCAPLAGAMISSLRAFGYDFATAIADLIDNSLFANARNVWVDYSWNDGKPWFRVTDDGTGMTESVLKDAMRLGSKSPQEEREKLDLGRFGLGLKTAAFSQGKMLSVRTKTESGEAVERCWDLGHVEQVNRWELLLKPPARAGSLLNRLSEIDHGTVVLCQDLDRLLLDVADPEAENNFLHRFDFVAKYLEMVFHRFLNGRRKVNIFVGRHKCSAWDPFLESNQFTQERATESLNPKSIKVTPFVLPHVSKRTSSETTEGAGLYGWNAQQGFYVYRNKRMIISGGYLDFDFKSEEHYKLCRIRIDLPNCVDHQWGVDVRKASASPPSHVRNDLARIAKSTRSEACEIYRARTKVTRRKGPASESSEIWSRAKKGDKVVYRINRQNEAIQQLIQRHGLSKSLVNQLFHIIEHSVPHRSIVLDNAEHEDCLVDLPPETNPPPSEALMLCEEIFRSKLKVISNPDDAAKLTCLSFPPHVGYRAHLDKLIAEIDS